MDNVQKCDSYINIPSSQTYVARFTFLATSVCVVQTHDWGSIPGRSRDYPPRHYIEGGICTPEPPTQLWGALWTIAFVYTAFGITWDCL
jgi:hypothetical protein